MSECELVSDDVLAYVCAGDRGPGDARRVQARLAGLEHRVTELASSNRVDVEQRRALDDVAGLLISVRGAIEATSRLRADADAPSVVRTAAEDLLMVRTEDLRMALHTFENDADLG